MKQFCRALAILMALAFLGCVSLYPQSGNATKPASESKANSEDRRQADDKGNWYRIEYVLSEFENGKKTNTRNFTVLLEQNIGGAIKAGSRVPIMKTIGGSGSNDVNYMDVGLRIECRIREVNGTLSLNTLLNISSLANPEALKSGGVGVPIVRQVSSDTTTSVVLGRPVKIVGIDDPSSEDRRYVLEATVTKAP